ncbi:rod-binding protein [Consotaella salsifontis]|uniref:Rod binding protein n=1 Tax=Consotaella salsifontis TaxID=1365950 RepID=A0A1T4NU30_9HYPH|nr:rod-binding protein [Consotaella salsifontis]SJZ82238.1 Rod binding protein [Consotaella salsifontis]
MAITPPTDLVLDVMRAAGPDASDALASRLGRVGPASTTATADQALAFNETMKSEAKAAAPASSDILPLGHHESRKASPYEKFEAFVLRSFVESMLPSEESGFYGDGAGANIWRSMMAEQVGDQIAKDGGIGIAEMLERRAEQSKSGQLADISTDAATAGMNAVKARASVLQGLEDL